MLKRLLVWIMLFALPLQSYAAAAMINCEASHHMAHAAAAVQHDGHGDASASGHQHAADAAAGDHQHDAKASADKCSACHSCCMSTVSLIGFQPDFSLSAAAHVLAPHPIVTLSSIILDGLQRPPRSSLA